MSKIWNQSIISEPRSIGLQTIEPNAKLREVDIFVTQQGECSLVPLE